MLDTILHYAHVYGVLGSFIGIAIAAAVVVNELESK